MEISGIITKMRVEAEETVQYYLRLNETEIYLNSYLGKPVRLEFQNKIHCLGCGKRIFKTYGQGYCFPCFDTLPENEECVLRPELCKAHLGIARDMEYASKHCLTDHIVYLSLTSEIKVGITRFTQIPTRWIDQGATEAIQLARVKNRYEAGRIEVELKKNMPDKTNWRAMLMGQKKENLLLKKDDIINTYPELFQNDIRIDSKIHVIHYPILEYPSKPETHNLDKEHVLEGTLTGIKGQYLMIDKEKVINIRKYGGYLISFHL